MTVDIVTTGFFETLGVRPVYGRDFTRWTRNARAHRRAVRIDGQVRARR